MQQSTRKSPRQSLSERLERSRRHRQWLAKDSASSVGGGSTGSYGTAPSASSETAKPKAVAPKSSNANNSFDIGIAQSSSSHSISNSSSFEERESLSSRRQKALQMGRKRNSSSPALPPTVPHSVPTAPKLSSPVHHYQRDIQSTNSHSLTVDTHDDVVEQKVQSRSPSMQQPGAMHDDSHDDDAPDDEGPVSVQVKPAGSYSRPIDSFNRPSYSHTQGRVSYSGNAQPKPGSTVTPSWVKKSASNDVEEFNNEQQQQQPKRNFVQPKPGSSVAPSWVKWSDASNVGVAPPSPTANKADRKWTPSQPKQSPQAQRIQTVRTGSWSSPKEAPRPSPMSGNARTMQPGSPSARNELPVETPPKAAAAVGIETPDVVSVASLRASFNSRGSNQPIMPMNSPDPRVRQSFSGSNNNAIAMVPKSPRPSWQNGRATAPLPPTQRYGSAGKFSVSVPSKPVEEEVQNSSEDIQVDWPTPDNEMAKEERPPPSGVKMWQANRAPGREPPATGTTTPLEQEAQVGEGDTNQGRAAPSVFQMWQAKQAAKNNTASMSPRADTLPLTTTHSEQEEEEEDAGEGDINHGGAAPSVLKKWQAKQGSPNTATDSTILETEVEAAVEPEAPDGGGNADQVRAQPSVLKMWQTKQGAPNSVTDSIRTTEVETPAIEPEPVVFTGGGYTDEELRPSNVLKMWHNMLGGKNGPKPEGHAKTEERSTSAKAKRQKPSVVQRWQSKPNPATSEPDNDEEEIEGVAGEKSELLETKDEVVFQGVSEKPEKLVVVAPEEADENSPEKYIPDEETRAMYSKRASQMQKSYSKAPWQHDSSPRRQNNDQGSSFWRAKAEATYASATKESSNTASTEQESLPPGPVILPETSNPKVPPMFAKTSPKSESPNVIALPSNQLHIASPGGSKEAEQYEDEIERRALEIVGKMNRMMPSSFDVVEEKKSSEDLMVNSDRESEDHSTRLARMAADSSLVADFDEVMKHAAKSMASYDEDSSTGNYSGNPSALPENLPDEFQRVLSGQSHEEYYLGVKTSFSMQNENPSSPQLAIKESDSTSAYIEDENYVDDESSSGEDSSPMRLTIKQSDSTNAYIEDDTSHNRESVASRGLATLVLPSEAEPQEPAQQQGNSNILSPAKSVDSSNHPVLTPSRRDSEAYRVGYYGDASPRTKGNYSPQRDQKSTISPRRTIDQSPSGGRGNQVDQVLRFWAKETASEDEHDEALNFTGEDEWGDRDPDLDPFADDDSGAQENKGPEKTIRFSDPPAQEAIQTQKIHEPHLSRSPAKAGKETNPKKSEKKNQENVVFDPFADDDEDGLIIDNPDDFFSPESADPFMTAESFSPLNWGTPRSQDIPVFNHADISPEFQVGFEI